MPGLGGEVGRGQRFEKICLPQIDQSFFHRRAALLQPQEKIFRYIGEKSEKLPGLDGAGQQAVQFSDVIPDNGNGGSQGYIFRQFDVLFFSSLRLLLKLVDHFDLILDGVDATADAFLQDIHLFQGITAFHRGVFGNAVDQEHMPQFPVQIPNLFLDFFCFRRLFADKFVQIMSHVPYLRLFAGDHIVPGGKIIQGQGERGEQQHRQKHEAKNEFGWRIGLIF